MKNKKSIFFLLVTLVHPLVTIASTCNPIHKPFQLSLRKVLILSTSHSYAITASQLQNIVAEKDVAIARANCYPTLDFQGIDSGGFPGSNGQLGIGGMMGSPFRKELGVGFVAQQIVYDFGRTAADIKLNKEKEKYSEANTRVKTYEVQLLALQTYYKCMSYQSQIASWAELKKQSALIAHEVNHFVKTGQRSIVDRYIAKEQEDKANTYYEYFLKHLKRSKDTLSIMMGISTKTFECPVLQAHNPMPLSVRTLTSSPLYTRSVIKTEVAQQKLNYERSRYHPRIIAEASIGNNQTARLVDNKAYAVGIGIDVPIFRQQTLAQIQKARAQFNTDNEKLLAEEQMLEELNAQYNEDIKSSIIQIRDLRGELQYAQKGYSVAKQRYFEQTGNLLDLQDAFRNLERIQTNLIEARTRLLQAQGAKLLMNGGKLVKR